jgi:DNA polymerase I
LQHKKLSSRSEVLSVLSRLTSPVLAVDTETTGLDPHTDKLISVVIGTKDEGYSFSPAYVDCLLEWPRLLVFHNMKFDLHFLMRAGIDLLSRPIRDTMLMHHLVDETAPHSLGHLVQHYFQDNYKEEFWAKYKAAEEAPEDERLVYETKDTQYTARIYDILRAELHAEEIPESLVEHVHRLALSLWRTEYDGLAVDLDYLTAVGTKLSALIEDLKPKMRGMVESHCEAWELDAWAKELDKRKTPKGKAGVPRPEFSFDSSTQLKSLLYDRLKLPVQKDQKTKNVTTGDDALVALEQAHPLVPLLREYRGHQKVYGAYIEGTLERLRDGRIYPEFNVNGTKTGRISHSNPNMGQLPSTGGIRGIYVPDPGNAIISADYKQLEVCIAAHFSRDPNLLKIVHEGASQHDITAQSLGIPRPIAKTLNFAMQYRCSPRKVAQVLDCSQAAAEHAYNKYWETYAGLKALMEECDARVEQGLPIVSPFGRKRRFPTKFEEHWHKEKAKRQAFNFLIQSTGGDITSRALYLADEALRERGWGKALFSVHDECLISPTLKRAEESRALLSEIMVARGPELGLTVPLAVDCSGPQARWED